MKHLPAIVGVDTGGTFTDLIAFVGREVRTHKVLSTPENPALAVLRGLRELLPDTTAEVVSYGSTVATNALLQRRGARVVLLTTAGFEDIIEIGRQNRPLLYDLEPHPPEPLVPPGRRIGIAERLSYDGAVVQPLSRHTLESALRRLRRERPEAVAVCFLHAYANPTHERVVGRALARFKDVFCSLSHQLVAEYREYERVSTTVVNAYVGPVMSGHLGNLQHDLHGVHLRVMQSNGGVISASRAAREAVRTVLSGPAAGVIGAWSVARAMGLKRAITFDMGGTSTDVCLIDGAVALSTEWSIGGLPLKVPAIDIHTVGAGGGSVAGIDAGGALKVGPESAGADPGPACYGKGQLATVTDANALLGRLVAEQFLGGRMRLDLVRARQAMQRLGHPTRLSWEQAAEGIVRVVNASMERAIRKISVERGHDPRDYVLIAFGGAAGQHVCDLCAALGIRRAVLPRYPGLLSAWGAAAADVQRDHVRTVRLTNPTAARLHVLFRPLEARVRHDMRSEGVPDSRCVLARSVDVRYAGQSYEIGLPFGARLRERFHAAHRRLYGYADLQRPIEVVNVRVMAVGRSPRLPSGGETPRPRGQPVQHRVRWGARWHRARAHQRADLTVASTVRGPAVIAEFSATTFIPPGWRASVHPTGHLILTHAR